MTTRVSLAVRRRAVKLVLFALGVVAVGGTAIAVVESPFAFPLWAGLSGVGASGTGAFLWFGRPFPELDIELAAHAGGGAGHGPDVTVDAMLFFHNQRHGHCFVAPPGLRVAFDGHALEMKNAGREQPSGPGRNGIDTSDLFPCENAWFVSRAGDRIDVEGLAGPARLTIDLDSRHAEMTVPDFFRPRRLQVVSAARARAGSRVVVEHQPASDELGSRGSPPSVRLVSPGAPPVELEPKDGVELSGSRWRFPLPRLPPGAVAVQVSAGGAVWYAAIGACRGVHRCAAQVPVGLHPQPAPTVFATAD